MREGRVKPAPYSTTSGREKGYAYTELNVETDANAKELFEKLQAPGVPVMLVGDREIIG
jgi:hypothetical protein